MTARDDLFINISSDLRFEEALCLIDAYAHELAERIRRLRDDCKYTKDDSQYWSMTGCANFIDPEVNNGWLA